MKKFLVDTDILIDFLRGNENAKDFIKQKREFILLSSITVAELYSGVRNGKERTFLDEFIELFFVCEVTKNIAVAGGLYKRKYFKSHGTGLADALIAATAKEQKLILCSLNKKHFPMIENFLKPYEK